MGTEQAISPVAWEVCTTTTRQWLLHLHFYSPCRAWHQLLLSALFQQWRQLRFSYWIERQWGVIMNDITAPNWAKLRMHITLKTNFELVLPERYLAMLVVLDGNDSSHMSGLARGTTGTVVMSPYNLLYCWCCQ
jgi:hypothetical protein